MPIILPTTVRIVEKDGTPVADLTAEYVDGKSDFELSPGQTLVRRVKFAGSGSRRIVDAVFHGPDVGLWLVSTSVHAAIYAPGHEAPVTYVVKPDAPVGQTFEGELRLISEEEVG